jgi:hypothetical protein
MRHLKDGPPPDQPGLDVIVTVMALLSAGILVVGAARLDVVLMWIAGAIVFPATVIKVRSTRAKSRWWYEHGDAWRARQKENQPQN